LFTMDAPTIKILREKFNVPVFQIQITTITLQNILDAVKNNIQDFTYNIIEELETQLEYKSTSQSSIDYLYESLDFHPKIKKASERLFKDGHYSQAILDAFKELCNIVKKESGRPTLNGKDLMAKVFNEKNPIIRLNKLETKSEKDEQEGFKFIFMGSMVGIRNPRAHELLEEKDPYKVLEYLALASLLAKKAEGMESTIKIKAIEPMKLRQIKYPKSKEALSQIPKEAIWLSGKQTVKIKELHQLVESGLVGIRYRLESPTIPITKIDPKLIKVRIYFPLVIDGKRKKGRRASTDFGEFKYSPVGGDHYLLIPAKPIIKLLKFYNIKDEWESEIEFIYPVIK
ncbi:TIGR02391 family protein, partial [[Eubacterium] cellulosolvens]